MGADTEAMEAERRTAMERRLTEAQRTAHHSPSSTSTPADAFRRSASRGHRPLATRRCSPDPRMGQPWRATRAHRHGATRTRRCACLLSGRAAVADWRRSIRGGDRVAGRLNSLHDRWGKSSRPSALNRQRYVRRPPSAPNAGSRLGRPRFAMCGTDALDWQNQA